MEHTSDLCPTRNKHDLVFISKTAPVSRLRCGLQQLQLPLIRKHVLILYQQAIGSQLGEQIDQLRKGKHTLADSKLEYL